MEIICEAPAKINLFLAVTGRRDDGFHDLETRMVKINLSDRLHLRRLPDGVALSCPDSDLPSDRTNIAFRAADDFLTALGRGGVSVVLEKRIPVAAGLGGGSSDAAAVLLGLNRLYGFPFSSKELVELSRPLGADVPFFVTDCVVACATGIGDEIHVEKGNFSYWIVLVNPGFAVSTRWVYENFALTRGGNPYILGRDCDSLAGPAELPLYNDLEGVTIGAYPELAQIKNELIAGGAKGALMSGSGPTVFGLFEDKAQAQKSVVGFAKRFGRNVFLTRALSDGAAC